MIMYFKLALFSQVCKKYQMPKGNSSEWTYAEQLATSFHSPKIFLPEDLALKFSAHVQIYLLPRAQVCYCCFFVKHVMFIIARDK